MYAVNPIGLNYVNGLNISRVSNTELSISPGQIRDNNNEFDIQTQSHVSVYTNKNGLNGLDTGTIGANNKLFVFIIAKSSKVKAKPEETGFLLSLSATAPLMPSGYDLLKIIGWWNCDSSGYLIPMRQIGNASERKYIYDAPITVLSAGGATTYTAQSLVSAVPAIDNTLVDFHYSFVAKTAGNTFGIRATGSSSTNQNIGASPVASPLANVGEMPKCLSKIASSVPSIDYVVSESTVDALTLSVKGFTHFI